MKIIIHDKGSKTTIGNSEVAIKNDHEVSSNHQKQSKWWIHGKNMLREKGGKNGKACPRVT